MPFNPTRMTSQHWSAEFLQRFPRPHLSARLASLCPAPGCFTGWCVRCVHGFQIVWVEIPWVQGLKFFKFQLTPLHMKQTRQPEPKGCCYLVIPQISNQTHQCPARGATPESRHCLVWALARPSPRRVRRKRHDWTIPSHSGSSTWLVPSRGSKNFAANSPDDLRRLW